PEVGVDVGHGTPGSEIHRGQPGMQAWFERPVRDAAVVYAHEQRAGSVWRPPYSVEVTRLLQSGENTLRVMVDNLAINEMAGSALPDYRLLNSRYGVRFAPQDLKDLQVLPSGLLGAVRSAGRGPSDTC